MRKSRQVMEKESPCHFEVPSLMAVSEALNVFVRLDLYVGLAFPSRCGVCRLDDPQQLT